jgi:hypothetical protein
VLQAGKDTIQGAQHQLGAHAVVPPSGMHHDFEQESLGIHDQMAFAPVNLLAAVKAMGAALLGRLGRLAVNDPGAGLGLAPDADPQGFA